MTRLLASVLAFLALAVMAAMAQDAPPEEPILGQATDPMAVETKPGTEWLAETPGVTFRILAIGDGLGGGLGAGMTRLAEAGGKFEVSNRFNESSGIARPEVYDWTETVTRISADNRFDAAVVLLGSNDRQDIRLGQFRYAFGSPDWLAAYKLQTETLLDALKAQGVQVFWVSVPPMADPVYNADMNTLNAIFKERVTARGETFVDIRPAFLGIDGQYTDKGVDETGTVRKLRSRDGVSFFKQGNNRLAQLVYAAIEERRKSPIVAAVNANAAVAGAVSESPDAPLLGQALGGGESETINSRDVLVALAELAKKQAVTAAVVAKPVVAKLKIIDVVAASGSAAERLLTSGIADPAPAGRFDDFSVFAPAAQ